jgi:hypothetical protein
LKSGIVGLGVIAILMLVVFASGCTGSKVLFTYNLSDVNATNYVGVENFTIPNGTSKVTIEADNLTKFNSNINQSYVTMYFLSTVPTTVTVNGSNTDFMANYNSNIIVQKNISLANETNPISFNFTSNNTQLKGILILNVNAKGLIQILAQ